MFLLPLKRGADPINFSRDQGKHLQEITDPGLQTTKVENQRSVGVVLRTGSMSTNARGCKEHECTQNARSF